MEPRTVRQASITGWRRIVEPATRSSGEPDRYGAHSVGRIKTDVGTLAAEPAIHPHVAGSIDQDVRDSRERKQPFERTKFRDHRPRVASDTHIAAATPPSRGQSPGMHDLWTRVGTCEGTPSRR